MLHQIKSLKGCRLHCLDGEIGSVEDFYFDDHHWTIRYLVANSGGWLTGRQVLVSPYAIASVNTGAGFVKIDLTKKQIEGSPSLDDDKPVSRQYEEAASSYYGWPLYWNGPHLWGPNAFLERDRKKWLHAIQVAKGWDPQLRSAKVVTGYAIQALDGEVGQVADFLVDAESWAIQYLIVQTRHWGVAAAVMVSPQWINHVSWKDSRVFVNVTSDIIKHSPPYSESTVLNREYELRLHDHFKQPEFLAKHDHDGQVIAHPVPGGHRHES